MLAKYLFFESQLLQLEESLHSYTVKTFDNTSAFNVVILPDKPLTGRVYKD